VAEFAPVADVVFVLDSEELVEFDNVEVIELEEDDDEVIAVLDAEELGLIVGEYATYIPRPRMMMRITTTMTAIAIMLMPLLRPNFRLND